MKCLKCVMFLLFWTLTSYAKSDQEIVVSAKNAVSFKAETNIFVTVEGTGPILDGKVSLSEDVVSGEFSVQVDQFKTGDDERDEHLKETFEAKKYPLASLKIDKVKYREGKFPFKGDLKIKDKSKHVEGECSKKAKAIECKFVVKQSDYGLKIPQTIATKLGAKVDDKIDVKVNFSI